MCRRIVLYYAKTSTAGEFTGVTKDLGGASVRRVWRAKSGEARQDSPRSAGVPPAGDSPYRL